MPSGLYSKALSNGWVGYGNYDHLPNVFNESDLGKRVTINNKSYELMKDDDDYVWCEKSIFIPSIFYDFYELEDNSDIVLANNGNSNSDTSLNVSNIALYEDTLFPFICTTVSSTVRTNSPVSFGDKFTFSALFLEVSRLYQNDPEKMIQADHFAVLMHIKDEFANTNVGICYDSDLNLYFFDGLERIDLNYNLIEKNSYQISLRVNGSFIDVLIDEEEVASVSNESVKDKNLFFSICNDMGYGQYANGAATFGEIQIFKELLSTKENSILKKYPRTWNFFQGITFLDLNLEELMGLKKLYRTDLQWMIDNSINSIPRSNSFELESDSTFATSTAVKNVYDFVLAVSALAETKEQYFEKNSAFNLNLGTTAGTVAEGNHTHPEVDLTGIIEELDGKSDIHEHPYRSDVWFPTPLEISAEPAFTKNSGFNLEKSDDFDSTSSEILATSKAVSTAYNKAIEACDLANVNSTNIILAQTKANEAYDLANEKLGLLSKADDSSKLNGLIDTPESTPSTIVSRNELGSSSFDSIVLNGYTVTVV